MVDLIFTKVNKVFLNFYIFVSVTKTANEKYAIAHRETFLRHYSEKSE